VPIVHLRVNAGAVNGELAVALPHHLESRVGRQGSDHPQPLAFHTKTLEPVQQRQQDGAAGQAGQEHQHAAAGIDAGRQIIQEPVGPVLRTAGLQAHMGQLG